MFRSYFQIFKIALAILLMLAFAVCACGAFFLACSGESYDYGPDSEDSMTITDTSDPVFDPMEEIPDSFVTVKEPDGSTKMFIYKSKY